MKKSFGGGRSHLEQALRVVVRSAWISFACAALATVVKTATASVKTFDLLTYSEPAGFEVMPTGSDNHVTFRRVDPAGWILFSIYGSRAAPKDLATEFAFDWNDLNAASGVAAPSSIARKVGATINAREGGAFVSNVGYVDLVDVDAGGKVVAIIIECGSADQFRGYHAIIDTFLASIAVKGASKTETTAGSAHTSAGAVASASAPAPVSRATTHEVDYVNDGFVWKGADGLERVPPLTTVASGAGFPASIPGIWQNEREQFTLELAADGTYASAYAAAAGSGSFRTREAGHWKADGTKLVLTPESATLTSRTGTSTRSETVKQETGGPRTYEVTALVLEYSRDNATSRIDGIELKGPTAPWYYTPSGKFSMVFRRTGAPRAQ